MKVFLKIMLAHFTISFRYLLFLFVIYYFFSLFISNLWKKNLEDIALTELGH